MFRTLSPRWIPILIGIVAVSAMSLIGPSRVAMAGDDTKAKKPDSSDKAKSKTDSKDEKMKVATFGGGCFWCTEAVFQRIRGVESVTSGYSGGEVKNPTYKQVCTGETGHAEVIQIKYDPEQVKFEKLLEVFWKTHDPTTLNRQGADVGTQYRSAVFYVDDEQKKIAEQVRDVLNKEVYDGKIVTEISPLKDFYAAEDYHKDYFNLNKKDSYCRAVIVPKVEKFEKIFKDILKK